LRVGLAIGVVTTAVDQRLLKEAPGKSCQCERTDERGGNGNNGHQRIQMRLGVVDPTKEIKQHGAMNEIYAI